VGRSGPYRVDLTGSGPFVLPLMIHVSRLEIPEERDVVVAEFLSHNEKQIFAAISYQAVEQLVKAHQSAPLHKTALGSLHEIDLSKPADAYELPRFSSFDGYILRAPERRTLVLSTEYGQRVLFPLGPLTYQDLLEHLKAALLDAINP
jgi:hypothetical protein